MAQTGDIAGKKLLHNYHEAFYKLFHLPLDYLAPDNRNFTICGKAHCNALCAKIMESETGAALCATLTRQRIAEAKRTRRPVVNRCHAGFFDALIPIFADGDYMGSLCIGQFLRRSPDEAEVAAIRKDLAFLEFEPGELENYCRNTRIMNDEEVDGLVELVQMLGEYICESHMRLRFLESMRSSDPVRTAEQYIQRHYAKHLTVDGIARSVGMSKSYFMHKFTEQNGTSPIAYLNSFRVTQAAGMLTGTKIPISEVAYQCGFQTLSHFNRQFRKVFGESPRRFRNANRRAGSAEVSPAPSA